MAGWRHICYGQENKHLAPGWTYCPTCGTMQRPTDTRDGRMLGILAHRIHPEDA